MVHHGPGPQAGRRLVPSLLVGEQLSHHRPGRRRCCWRSLSACRSRSASARAMSALLRAALAGVPGTGVSGSAQAAKRQLVVSAAGPHRRAPHGPHARRVSSRADREGVPCTPFYPHPLYGNPLYSEGGCRVETCPVAEACIGDAFWLPHRALLGDAGNHAGDRRCHN